MAPQVPSGWPAYLTAGTDWQWTAGLVVKVSGDTVDPADAGWTLVKAYFLGKTSIIVSASVVDGLWKFVETDTNTSVVAAGSYRYQILGTYGGLIYELAASPASSDAVLEILATPAVSAASDQRTHNERMLALCEAEIVARMVGGVGSAHEAYGNGDTSLQKIPMTDLEALRNKYALAVQMERHSGRLPPYAVVFTRPGMVS